MTQKIKSILLVEDDLDDQLLFREALSEVDNSISYLSAVNGINALEVLNYSENTLPSIIFMDVNMPKMNGIDCLKELQKLQKFQLLPVIMYSTSCSLEHQQECFKNGAIGYFEKPNNFDELCSKIKCVLEMEIASIHNNNPITL